MIGYVLPVAGILQREFGPWGSPSSTPVTLQTCGPVMDRVLTDVLAPSNLDLSLGEITGRRFRGLRERLHHERWIQVPRTDSDAWWYDLSLPATFDDLSRNVTALDQLLALHPEPDHCAALSDRVIVLRRSPQPDYYAEGAGAVVPTYGTGRRSLTNVDELVDALRSAGVAASAYEPGEHSLRCQAAVFGSATGIVGIRGAELANLLWARPGTRVVVVQPVQVKGFSPAIRLAEFRHLEWTTVPASDTTSAVEPALVLGPLLD